MSRTRSWKNSLGPDKLVIGPDGRGARSTIARKLARVTLTLTLVLVAFCGLFPFDFIFEHLSHQIAKRFDFSAAQWTTGGDMIENVFFFIPFGFALGTELRRNWLKWFGTAAVAMVLSCALSTLVEIGQCFLASRDPSITDIVNNSIGGAIGFGIYRLVGEQSLTIAAKWLDRMQHRLGAVVFGIATALFATIICAAPLILGGDAGNLSAWNPGYGLAMGNEIGAQRGWPGYVQGLHIASVAASDGQVSSILAGQSPFEIFNSDTLLASYDLHGDPPFADATGKEPALDWASRVTTRPTVLTRSPTTRSVAPQLALPTTAPAPPPASGPPVNVWDKQFLRSAGPMETLNRAIAASNQFTVILAAAATRPDPAGQARIATISAGATDRNLMLAQQDQDLLVRIRTDTTGSNGDAPQFLVKDVFADKEFHLIVVTFRDAMVRVFVDKLVNRTAARITPEAATIWSMYPRTTGWSFHMGSDDSAIQAPIYRGLSLFLLGILTAAMVNLLPGRTRLERVAIGSAVLVATIIVLEALLTTLGNQPFRISGIVVSFVAAAIGLMLVGVRKGSSFVAPR